VFNGTSKTAAKFNGSPSHTNLKQILHNSKSQLMNTSKNSILMPTAKDTNVDYHDIS